MKIGVADYGLNVWFGSCFDLETRLKELKKIGYEGIERLDNISNADDAVKKACIFRRNGMDFGTCRGNGLPMNIQMTSAFGKDYIWLEINAKTPQAFYSQSNELGKASKSWGVTTLMHNHLGQAFAEQQPDVEKFLETCPDCGLLLDVGHFCGAGGDVMKFIEKYHKKIHALHLKDFIYKNKEAGFDKWWDKLRFCELGGGELGDIPANVLKFMVKKGFDGWVFVEHDTHLQDPYIDLEISRKYLKKAGF